jgi:molybdate transport system permease protein
MGARQGRRRRSLLPAAGLAAAIAAYTTLLALPLLGLLWRVDPAQLVAHLAAPAVVEALRLSLLTASVATAVVIVLGMPLAYVLAMREFRGKRALEVLVDLPIVLPPTVAGTALLLAFGRQGLAGSWLAEAGITLPFTTAAVILAQVFVASPFFVNAARAGFEEVEPHYLRAAATLRATPAYTFFHVVLPLSRPAILAGTAMTAARALGEFGATIVFAGNFPGRTQTMPLAVYVALHSDVETAVVLSLVLLLVSLGLLTALRAFGRGRR